MIVTIDFWNTLFDSTGGEPRNAARFAALQQAVEREGLDCETDALMEAYRSIWSYFDHHWLEQQRTPTSSEMVREICRRADLQMRDEIMEEVATIFERGIMDHPPELLPGAREALEFLSSRARLAIISDTAFSPGAVLRELMDMRDVSRYFDAFVFSDETGVSKPHRKAFEKALAELGGSADRGIHIGDIERTDIRGARAAGMRAILYRGDRLPHKYTEETTEADAVMEHWGEIEAVLERMGVV